MVMLQPWVGLLSVAFAVAVVAVVVMQRRRHPDDLEIEAPIANVQHANASAVFRRLRRRYTTLLGAEFAALSVVGLSAVALTMRPIGDRENPRDVHNRDVMLCLDVSGSMIELDAEILERFAVLTAGLEGERIGLTIWNGSAVTIFPLTDDADYIAATLDEAAVAIVEHKQLFVEGTNEGGSSLIGDGLASCVMRFDRLEEPRARSIIFATDNMRAGSSIMTLDEAGKFAQDRGIRVYAMAARHIPDFAAVELKEVAVATGGDSFPMLDEDAVDEVIDRIADLEASRLDLPAEVVSDDRPTAWIVACLAGIGVAVAAGWGLRR